MHFQPGNDFNVTHGWTRGRIYRPEYRAWIAMRVRCDPENKDTRAWYADRGIRVCDRWLTSFQNFLADMGPRPSAKHSLDRFPNNAGNYEPGNVRWATVHEQQRNRSSNRYIEAFGQRKLLKEWSEQTGISVQLISYRLRKGIDPEKALTTPPNQAKAAGGRVGGVTRRSAPLRGTIGPSGSAPAR